MRGRSGRFVMLAAVAVASLSACAPVMGAATTVPVDDAAVTADPMLSMLHQVADVEEARAGQAPRVWLHTYAPFAGSNRVDISYGVTEDAYVLVGMVGRDGELHILHPGRSSDAHFLGASQSRRLDGIFTGHNVAPYGSGLHMTGSALTDYGRNTGYAFAIASDRPLGLAVLDELGWWATPDLARDFQAMSPRLFAHRIASLIVRDDAQYSIDAVSVRSDASYYAASPLAYSSALCSSTNYLAMDPLSAQSLIRFQLSSGCSVPSWAIRRFVWPVQPVPTGVNRRQPLPPAQPADTSALLRDGRVPHEQVRSHVEGRRPTAGDSAAAEQRSLMLRGQELRRQILEVERQRALTRSDWGRPVPLAQRPASGADGARTATGAASSPARRPTPRVAPQAERPPAREKEPAREAAPPPPRQAAPAQSVRRTPPPSRAPARPAREPKPDQTRR